MNIFLTGATGFVGNKLAKDLLEKGHELYVLCRNNRKAEAFLEELSGSAREGVTCVLGNLDSPQLGIKEEDLQIMMEKIDAIYHMAAYLSFDPAMKEETFKVNVEGTRHAIEVAEKIGCSRFLYVSTAYTIGMETEGKEELYSLDREFVNPYEESKAHAEHLVYSFKDKLDILILRPAIIIGDSRTGEAETSFGMYGLLKAASLLKRKVAKQPDWQEHVYRFLGEKELRMNLVPVDYVVKVLKIALTEGEPGRIYNITNPAPLKQGEIFQAIKEVLDFPQLELVPDSEADTLTDLEKVFNDSLVIFTDYLKREIRFPCDNTISLLKKAGQEPLNLDYNQLKLIIEGYFKK